MSALWGLVRSVVRAGNSFADLGNQEAKEFKPHTIYLLEAIREKMAKGIHLKLEQHLINEQLVGELETCIRCYPGKSFVKISILDQEEGMVIPTLSKQYRVELSNELCASFAKLPIDFALCV